MTMEMKPGKGTSVTAYGYDAATRTLQVQFPSGTYSYHDVSPVKADELGSAESTGKYLQAHIKPHHKFVKHAAVAK
jgi:hypothetical protein